MFRAVVALRRSRHLRHPAAPSPVPVIVVGGITVGGTGKTPVLLALAKGLTLQGLKVGIVSRGYGGAVSDSPIMVEATSSAKMVGDEPLLLARAGCTVVVCQRRARAVAHLAQNTDVQVVLSDDGLQHYAMARDFEIAVLDAKRRLGNGWMLPMGPLREPASRLDEVDWLLVRNGDEPDTGFRYRPNEFYHCATETTLTIEEAVAHWRNKRVLAATGLGQPEQFFEVLERLGLVPQRHRVSDHAELDTSTLESYDAEVIVVTEKDAVKLSSLAERSVAPRLWVLRIEALLPQRLIDTIAQQLGTGGTV